MDAVIYSRVSTEIQDNERQIEELKEYAKYRKFRVAKVFQEKVSGAVKGADRNEFKAMQKYLSTNKATVLVWELSRLGRKMIDVMTTIEEFSDRGINIFIKKENLNTLDPQGKKDPVTSILLSVLSGFAEMERATIKQRAISGIRHNVLNGGAGTGFVKPFGYASVNKKLVIDKEEAETVKLIYKKYMSGLGTQQIAAYLNSQNIPTRYNKVYGSKEIKSRYGYTKKGEDYVWRDGTIYAILTNTLYKGDRKHKGEIFKVEPIIEADLFDKVQIRLKQKYNKIDNNTTHKNILRNLTVCGTCGRNYYLHERSNGKDKAFKCISKRYSESCGGPSIGKDKLNTALYCVSSPIIMQDDIAEKIRSKDKIAELFDNNEIQTENTRKDIELLSDEIGDLIKMKLKKQVDGKQFSKLKQQLEVDLKKKQALLEHLQAEFEKLNSLHKRNKNVFLEYTEEVFANFARHYIESVKIYPVTNKDVLAHFTNQQDTPVLIEVKPVLSDKVIRYAISQRSNILMNISADKEATSKDILKGKYRIAMIGKNKPYVTLHHLIDFEK